MVLWRVVFAAGCVAAVGVTTAAGQSTPAPGQPGVRAMSPIPDYPMGPRIRGRAGPQFLSTSDHVLFTRADDAAIHLDWGAARALAAQGQDRIARDIMEWRYALDDHGNASFENIVAVINAHPDWPRREALLARAEETMPLSMGPRAVLDWFQAHPPVSGYGRVRMGEAMVATGRRDEGIALIRKGWIEGDFDLNDEGAIMGRNGAHLGPETQGARLDRLLWTDDNAASQRQLGRASGEARAIGEVRLRLKRGLTGAQSVPESMRDHPGIIFERAKAFRRGGRDSEAWALMARAPHNPPYPERWWNERHIMARDALKARSYQRAYEVVEHHGLTTGTDYVDAQFIVGWIALRFLKEPALAERHFRIMTKNVGFPISRARAHYWLARSLEAMGKTGEAVAHYRRASREPGTFYGQLALARIEERPVLRVPDAGVADDGTRAALANDRRIHAMRVTADLGQKDLLRSFANQVARDKSDPATLKALAALMLQLGDRAGSVRIAKQASYGGTMALTYLHPVITLPRFPGAGSGPEPALVHGLIRQETEFDPEAISSAGARGLMQLMPASARDAARRYGMRYDLGALITDPTYNTQLGMGEFQTYLENFNGSYVLSIAAYNAGAGRSRQWSATYGDPRYGTDPIDWIELIPFGETRNYVMRVLENTEVYRNRLAGGDRPLMILTDLYRPAQPPSQVLRYSGPPVAVDGETSAAPAAAPQPRTKPSRRRGGRP
jgi:soluble lytic murein transglycosylase